MFIRAWMKLLEFPTSNHTSWIEVGAAVNEQNEMRFGSNEGVLQVNHWPGDQDQIAAGVTLTAGEWACIQLAYEPGTKTLEAWLGDTQLTALTVVGTFVRGGAFDPAPPLEAVRFGAEINATEAWFDDIAVGDSLIGCN
jgi:hypothetical protein